MDLLILILLGTQDKPFTRLLEAVDKEIEKGNITEEVVVQAGHTKYESDNMKIFDLIAKDDYLKYVSKANFIISHAGVGTIFDCLGKDKKIIVVPRLSKYGEHTNDHQLEITEAFGEKGFVIPVFDLENLGQALNDIKSFKVQKYQSNTKNIINYLEDYIDSNSKTN